MFRICQQNICLINKSIITCASIKDVVSKSIKISPKYSIRHFASGEKENSKLERIYYGPLTPQIRAVKLFSVGSSALGLAAQPIILREANTIGSTSLLIAICSVVGFFTFVTPILLHFITKKYVTEIHYNPESLTYRATTISFFLTPVKVSTSLLLYQFKNYVIFFL